METGLRHNKLNNLIKVAKFRVKIPTKQES